MGERELGLMPFGKGRYTSLLIAARRRIFHFRLGGRGLKAWILSFL